MSKVYNEKTEMLYCSKECALRDFCNENDLEEVFDWEVNDEDDDRFWYDTEDDCRMPMFGVTCCMCQVSLQKSVKETNNNGIYFTLVTQVLSYLRKKGERYEISESYQ